jgi:hypothetical protein
MRVAPKCPPASHTRSRMQNARCKRRPASAPAPRLRVPHLPGPAARATKD